MCRLFNKAQYKTTKEREELPFSVTRFLSKRDSGALYCYHHLITNLSPSDSCPFLRSRSSEDWPLLPGPYFAWSTEWKCAFLSLPYYYLITHQNLLKSHPKNPSLSIVPLSPSCLFLRSRWSYHLSLLYRSNLLDLCPQEHKAPSESLHSYHYLITTLSLTQIFWNPTETSLFNPF